MSVLACSRNMCENVMCDRYSRKFGYICGECFQELVNGGLISDCEIKAFMETEKTLTQEDKNRAEKHLKEVFSGRC